jgi:poly(3-hydroxybutyrate) depolymerase
MKYTRLLTVAVLLCTLVPSEAQPQALTSLSSLRTSYNTRKATVRPTGELKVQIDAIDQEIAAATRQGRTSEVRRLMAKGQSLLAGRPWTDVLDFSNSVVLRTEHVIADSEKPHAVLNKRPTPAAAGGNAVAPPPELVKDFGTFEGVSRDLRESPYLLELAAGDVPNGTYQLAVELLDDTRSLGTSTLLVNLRKGLDQVVTQLEADAKRAPEGLKAEILFPVDRMRNVNRGRLEMRTFDPDRDFATALEVATAVKANKDPFLNRTGDFKRHYLLQTVNEIMPYRMYVPKNYNAARAYPLVIALHGLGGTEDSFFESYNRAFPPLAEQHGYIVATPLGYRVDGGYGPGVANPSTDPVARRSSQASEDDVMQVLQQVRQHYKIDSSRIYLMGHSLGAIGTWKLGPKFPDIWAALGPIAGSGNAASLERIRHIPQIIVHGDDDRTVGVNGSRTMVAKMKELGIEHKYIEVPGGSHSGVVAPNLAAIFEFFNLHKR